MNYSFGDNKKRLGGSASSVTETKRRAVVAQTWNFSSKQPKLPSAGYITTVDAMNASTLAFENARNAGVVPRINLVVDIPSTTLTATVAATTFAPIRISEMIAIADTPVFSISPSLPFGLTFSAADGSISGTPMETIPLTNFTVTVTATTVYSTRYVNTSSFYLTVGDKSGGLTYRGYSGAPAGGSSQPTLVGGESANWGSYDSTGTVISSISSVNQNVLFDAANIPAEQYITAYFSGYFKAPETGTYTFTETSDDGFQWIFNGNYIINIPGNQRSGSGTTSSVSLVANRYYPISGLWSQGGGPGLLQFTAITINGTNRIGDYPITTLFYV